MATRWVAALVLVLVAGLSWVDGRAPAPATADAPAGEFAADRAMQTVGELAREPRPTGSPAADRVRDELVDRLSAAGLSTRLHSSTGVDSDDGRMSAGPVENVVATLPGTDPTGAVVLAAHYDSVAGGPGAADDMSSVAAIVEAVRALQTGPPLRNDLVVLITDAEEAGLLGAQAWVRDELGARPSVVVNFEARGVSGPSLMFQTSPGNAGLVRAFAEAVPHPVGDSSLVEAYRLLQNDTDLTRVLDAGRPGLNFAFIEEPVDYHTTGDAPENLSAASVQGHGEAALGLARVLGDRDLAPLDPAVSGAPAQGDATYFRFAGTLVVYPGWLVWPVAGLGALAVAGAVLLGRRRGMLTVPRVLGAAAGVLVTAAAGVAATAGLWQLLVALRPAYADTGPFLHRPGAVQLAAVALAVTVTALWYLVVRRWAGRAGAAAGAALVLALLGVVTAGTVPGASFLFALPATGAGLGLAAALLWRHRPVAATAAAALGAVPGAVLLVPLGWDLFTLSGITDGIPVAAQVLLLALLTVVLVPVPARPGTAAAAQVGAAGQVESGQVGAGQVGAGQDSAGQDSTRQGSAGQGGAGRGRARPGWMVPAGALVAAAVLAATGLVLDRPGPDRPQASHLSFLQDADTGAARWVSTDTAPAPWTAGHLDSAGADLPLWPSDPAAWSGPAAPLTAPGPAVEIVERTPQRLVLQVASPRGAPMIILRSERPLPSVTVTPAGRPAVRSGGVDEVRLQAVPDAGMRVELTRPAPGPVTITVSDLAPGLAGIPGFRPRPPELRGAADWDSDQIVLGRTVSG